MIWKMITTHATYLEARKSLAFLQVADPSELSNQK